MINQIDSFLNVISDPRNISPEDFAEYYPKSGELGNTKNLDKNTIENKFCQLQKFNITESWDGYVPLMPKIYALLVMFEKQSNNDKEIFLNYFALTGKDLPLKTQSFINEKKLSRNEYFEMLTIYAIFVSSLIKNIGNELTELKEVELVAEKPKSKTRDKRTTQKYKVGLLIAKGKLNKYWDDNKNGKSNNFTYNDILSGLDVSFDVVIKATMSDYKIPNANANKNVFNDIEVMSFIIDDCYKDGVQVDPYFLIRYEDLKAKTI